MPGNGLTILGDGVWAVYEKRDRRGKTPPEKPQPQDRRGSMQGKDEDKELQGNLKYTRKFLPPMKNSPFIFAIYSGGVYLALNLRTSS